MSSIVVMLIFALAAYFTWTRGIAFAFAWVYLPVLFLLSATKSISLPMLPDMTSQFAVGYGVIAGLVLKGGERLTIRWNMLDTVIVALWVVNAISSGATGGMELARNAIGDGFFDFLTPYFLARIAFQSAEGRRAAFWSVTVCAGLIALMSPIEMRLWPQFWSRQLDAFGLFTPANSMPLYRFGLARAQTTFWQPMDQGNSGLLMLGMIGLFACTTALGWRNWRTITALGVAGFVAVASLSFSAFLNIAIAAGLFFALRALPDLGRVLAVFVVVGILGGVAVTNHLLSAPLAERGENFGQTVNDSVHMRTRIVQEGWPVAMDAGWVGFGKEGVERELSSRSPDKNYVKSIDNAYLLMIMQKGWPYFLLFMTIPFIVAFRTSAAFARAPAEMQRLPVIFVVAVLFAIFIAMYTIFFGFVYARLLIVMLGLFASLTDVLTGRVMLESERRVETISTGYVRQPAGAFPAMAGRS